MAQIVSVKEARKLIGAEFSARLDDAQVKELVNQLDFLATLAIRDYEGQQCNKTEDPDDAKE